MKLEQYKAKKLDEFRSTFKHSQFVDYSKIEDFISQTIDDLWKLPDEIELSSVENLPHIKNNNHWRNGWNACIDEAERMRLSIKK